MLLERTSQLCMDSPLMYINISEQIRVVCGTERTHARNKVINNPNLKTKPKKRHFKLEKVGLFAGMVFIIKCLKKLFKKKNDRDSKEGNNNK